MSRYNRQKRNIIRSLIVYCLLCIFFLSCSENKPKVEETVSVSDTILKISAEKKVPVENGVYEERYANGLIKVKGNYRGGKRHGSWVVFFDNGKIWSEGMYVNDIREGSSVVYHANGQKYYEGKYKDGKETGVWKFWDEKGNMMNEVDHK